MNQTRDDVDDDDSERKEMNLNISLLLHYRMYIQRFLDVPLK